MAFFLNSCPDLSILYIQHDSLLMTFSKIEIFPLFKCVCSFPDGVTRCQSADGYGSRQRWMCRRPGRLTPAETDTSATRIELPGMF